MQTEAKLITIPPHAREVLQILQSALESVSCHLGSSVDRVGDSEVANFENLMQCKGSQLIESLHSLLAPYREHKISTVQTDLLEHAIPQLRYFLKEAVTGCLYTTPEKYEGSDSIELLKYSLEHYLGRIQSIISQESFTLEIEALAVPVISDEICPVEYNEPSTLNGKKPQVASSLEDLLKSLNEEQEVSQIENGESDNLSPAWRDGEISKPLKLGYNNEPFYAGKFRTNDPEFHTRMCVTDLSVLSDNNGSLVNAVQYFSRLLKDTPFRDKIVLLSSESVPRITRGVRPLETEISMNVKGGSTYKIPVPLRYKLAGLNFSQNGSLAGGRSTEVTRSVFGEYQVQVPQNASNIQYIIHPDDAELLDRRDQVLLQNLTKNFPLPQDPVTRAIEQKARSEHDPLSAAALLVDAYYSRNNVYCRHEKLAEFIAACPDNILLLLHGLKMGSCATLSVELANLLSKVTLTLIAGGITPEPRNRSFLCAPGHAQVVVFADGTCRVLDPTVATDSGLRFEPQRMNSQEWQAVAEEASTGKQYEAAKTVRLKTVEENKGEAVLTGHHCMEDEDMRNPQRQSAIERMRRYIEMAKTSLEAAVKERKVLPLTALFDEILRDKDYLLLEKQVSNWLPAKLRPKTLILEAMQAAMQDEVIDNHERAKLLSWAGSKLLMAWRVHERGTEYLTILRPKNIQSLDKEEITPVLKNLSHSLRIFLQAASDEGEAALGWNQALAVLIETCKQTTTGTLRSALAEDIIVILSSYVGKGLSPSIPAASWPASFQDPKTELSECLRKVLPQDESMAESLFILPDLISGPLPEERADEIDIYFKSLGDIIEHNYSLLVNVEPGVFTLTIQNALIECLREGHYLPLLVLAYLPQNIKSNIDLSRAASFVSLKNLQFNHVLNNPADEFPISSLIVNYCNPIKSPSLVIPLLKQFGGLIEVPRIDERKVGENLVNCLLKVGLRKGDLIIVSKDSADQTLPGIRLRQTWKDAVALFLKVTGPNEFFDKDTNSLVQSLQMLPAGNSEIYAAWEKWKEKYPLTFNKFGDLTAGENVDKKELVRSALMSSIDLGADSVLHRHCLAFSMAQLFVKTALKHQLHLLPYGEARRELSQECKTDLKLIFETGMSACLAATDQNSLSEVFHYATNGMLENTYFDSVPVKHAIAYMQYFSQWNHFDEEPFPSLFPELLDHIRPGLTSRGVVWDALLSKNQRELEVEFNPSREEYRRHLTAIISGGGRKDPKLFQLKKLYTKFQTREQGSIRSSTSGEFVEYRPYTDNDSARSVDWKVWARTDKFVVRKLQEREKINIAYHVDLEWLDCTSLNKPSLKLAALIQVLSFLSKANHSASLTFYFQGAKILHYSEKDIKQSSAGNSIREKHQRLLPLEEVFAESWSKAVSAALYKHDPLSVRIPVSTFETQKTTTDKQTVQVFVMPKVQLRAALQGVSQINDSRIFTI